MHQKPGENVKASLPSRSSDHEDGLSSLDYTYQAYYKMLGDKKSSTGLAKTDSSYSQVCVAIPIKEQPRVVSEQKNLHGDMKDA